MASGKSLEMRQIDDMQQWRAKRMPEKVARDRSLSGKARRKARKDGNKLGLVPVGLPEPSPDQILPGIEFKEFTNE